MFLTFSAEGHRRRGGGRALRNLGRTLIHQDCCDEIRWRFYGTDHKPQLKPYQLPTSIVLYWRFYIQALLASRPDGAEAIYYFKFFYHLSAFAFVSARKFIKTTEKRTVVKQPWCVDRRRRTLSCKLLKKSFRQFFLKFSLPFRSTFKQNFQSFITLYNTKKRK